MNSPLAPDLNLPGLPPESPAAPAPKKPVAGRARVKPVDRSQLIWRTVDVEHLIEADHPARGIWDFVLGLDLAAFYAPIEAVEGNAGRPSWDPRLLVSLWVYAYSRGISSARELARRCAFDPAFQWLCGLAEINHHTLSDFRVLHGAALHELFVQVLGVLSAEGLVSLERVMHDGTKIKANASSSSFRREERLQNHLEAARQQLQSLEENAAEELTRQEAAQQRAARERQQRVGQALAELEKIRQAKGPAGDKAQARASTTDPQARIMKQGGGGYAPSYNVQLSTEATHKIIVGIGLSQNSSDYGELLGAAQRVEQNLGQAPVQMVVDGGYTSRQNIVDMAAQGIELIGPQMESDPSPEKQLQQRGLSPEFYPQAFQYEPESDTYRCPAGQILRLVGQEQRPGATQYQYRAAAGVCQACPWAGQCCPKNPAGGRSLKRTVEVPAVQQFREKMGTDPVKQIYQQRSEVAEFPNAWIKEKMGLRQFRLRGLSKVGLEALWAGLTYNIQQWIRLRWACG